MATYSWPLSVENVKKAGINCDLNNVALHIDQRLIIDLRKPDLFYYFSATMPLIKRSGSSRKGSGSNSRKVPPLKKSRSANNVRSRSIFLIDRFQKIEINHKVVKKKDKRESCTFSGCRSLWPQLS